MSSDMLNGRIGACQGVDEVWFAIMMMVAMVIGTRTPPFGFNLFYTKGILPKDSGATMKGGIYQIPVRSFLYA